MIYGLAASILPVWMLLTPRDYLSTFLKLGTVAALAVAVVLIQPDAADAGDHEVHRWQWTCFRRPGFSLCLHHDRLRRGLRVSFAHRFRDDAENDRARIANPRHRLWRDGDRDDGGA